MLKDQYKTKPLSLSAPMESLFTQKIIQQVKNHPLTSHYATSNHQPLGIPFQEVRQHIIKQGVADFSEPCMFNGREISTDEQVLLYCFINMKAHFFTACDHFTNARSVLSELAKNGTAPTLVDLGCGPGTSGLSFAEVHGESFNYIGVDTASAMREKCQELFYTGKSQNVITQDTTVKTVEHWDDVHIEANSDVIINSSYLFASHSLTPTVLKSLAVWLETISKRTEKTYFSYVNSTHAIATKRYIELQKFAKWSNEQLFTSHEKFCYLPNRTNCNVKESEYARAMFEIDSK